eukprot:1291937-Amphidinium_carterae.1
MQVPSWKRGRAGTNAADPSNMHFVNKYLSSDGAQARHDACAGCISLTSTTIIAPVETCPNSQLKGTKTSSM